MHIVDLDGRIYERIKRERQREFRFLAWSSVFCVAVLVLLIWGGGN